MAELVPELEDGESYLPSGILFGDDGWGGVGGEQQRQLLQRQSFFSDGVGGLPSYPPEHAIVARELTPSAMVMKGNLRLGAQNQRPRGNFVVSREGFEMSYLCSAVPPETVPGLGSGANGATPAVGRVVLSPGTGVYAVGSGFVYPFRPVKSAYAQVENCARMVHRQAQARFFSARAGGKSQKCGGTGVFLPLPRLQNDSRKATRGRDDTAAPQQKQENKSASGAKQGMSLQLPQDWTY